MALAGRIRVGKIIHARCHADTFSDDFAHPTPYWGDRTYESSTGSVACTDGRAANVACQAASRG